MTRLSRSPDPRWTSAVALAVAASGILACSSRKGSAPGAQDPERQSIAEHDVAVDALLKGNLRAALAHAKKAVELDEKNADAQLLTATVYLGFCTYSPEECRLTEAERHARAALKVKPDFREAKNTLGSILIHQRRYDDAIAVLKALTDDMLYATPEIAWGNLGWAYLEKGDVEQAIAALRRSVAVQPQFCWGNQKLALAYEKKSDYRAAEKALSVAIDTNRPECKSFPDALESRARIRQKLGEGEAAREDLERCSKIGAGTPAGKRCTASLGQSPP
jgi:type IV pilus assembly protein PilF